MDETTNPLTDGLLEGAAYICLGLATYARIQQFPPGSGDARARVFHERRVRFLNAREVLARGGSSVVDLGLIPEDLQLMIDHADRSTDPENWRTCFQSALDELKKEEKPCEQSAS